MERTFLTKLHRSRLIQLYQHLHSNAKHKKERRNLKFYMIRCIVATQTVLRLRTKKSYRKTVGSFSFRGGISQSYALGLGFFLKLKYLYIILFLYFDRVSR